MQHDWFADFFQGITIDLWRKAMTPEYTAMEVELLLEALAPPSGGRLLDVPSGNGRHCLELARRGFRTVGLDISEEFVAEARAIAQDETLDAEFHLGDMQTLADSAALESHQGFDGAYCLGNSFGYTVHEGTSAYLKAVAGALEPGASFLLNTGTLAECLLPNFEQRHWYQVEDVLMTIENRYDARASRLETDYVFHREGEEMKQQTSHNYVYTLAELGRMLVDAGLEVAECWGSCDRKPFELGDQELYLVARKR